MVEAGLDPPAGETSNFVNPDKTVTTWTIVVDAVGLSFVTILLLLRFCARHLVTRKYGLDDVSCILAFIGFVGYCSIDLLMTKYGGGIHQWNVPKDQVMPYTQAVYATMVIYGPTVFATKCAILLFLTRIFAPFERYCKFIYAFLGCMGTYYAIMLFLKIFICRPISKFWDSDVDGECFNQSALILTDNVISVVSDIAVLLIPCPLANFLKVGLKAKIRIGAIFGAGGIACICSIIRLVEIVKYATSTDQTWAFTLINLWGILEVAIGIVCACFPMLPMLWKHIFRRESTKSNAYSRSHPSHSGFEMMGSQRVNRSRTHPSGSAHRDTLIDNGSDENILIPASKMMTTSIHGGQLDMYDSTEKADCGENGSSRRKASFDEHGIMRTVEVEVHESLGKN